MLRVFAGPVGLVAVVLALVIAVGYWGKDAKPVSAPAAAPSQSPPGAAQPAQSPPQQSTTTPSTTPAPQQPAPPPVVTQPAEPDNAALLEKRKRIDRSGGAAKTMLATVYYADALTGGTSLQPVEVRIAQTDSIVQITAEQVVAAPTDLKLYSSVPAGAKVKSVNLNRTTGVATVDLSAEAAGVQGTDAAQTMRAAFVYSLTAIKDVKAVQLWVNGRPAVLHGIEWNQPLTRQMLEERSTFKVEPVVKFVP